VSLALTARSLLKRDLVVSGLSFLEMTRRAAGNTQMWNDVIHTNQSNILKSIREFRKILSEIESSVKQKNLASEFKVAKKFREKLKTIK
jgi:prephenate dehydrogenase